MTRRVRKGKKTVIILAAVAGVIIGLNILGYVVNTFLSKNELSQVEPYGQMVEVNGSKMHVYSIGNGTETIVLLPGLGVALPSADFGPLMRELSEHYTVVAVEYLGIGFSEETTAPRTNENYINELRAALDKGGYKPPYILMPHSISGVYSEYYAAKYPEEISSIIMLDTTSTAFVSDSNPPIKLAYSIGKLQQATGFTRLVFNLIRDPRTPENGYSETERVDYKRFNNHVINNSLISQAELTMVNIKEVNKLAFPEHIPILKLISTQSVAAMAKQDKDDGMGYQNAHLQKLGPNATYTVVEASHMLYQTKASDIAALTRDFLSKTGSK